MSALARAASIEDLRQLARRRLPRVVFDFIDGGAGNERTLRENQQAFAHWHLMPRVGVDVSDRSLATSIVGKELEPSPDPRADGARGALLSGWRDVGSKRRDGRRNPVLPVDQFGCFDRRGRGLPCRAETAGSSFTS